MGGSFNPQNMLQLTLPYPPSTNHHWVRCRNGGMRISIEGGIFRSQVLAAYHATYPRCPPLTGPLQICIDSYPPDRRRRDLDNIIKEILDALQHAGCYDDDNQFWSILIRRFQSIPKGRVVVRIDEFKPLTARQEPAHVEAVKEYDKRKMKG